MQQLAIYNDLDNQETRDLLRGGVNLQNRMKTKEQIDLALRNLIKLQKSVGDALLSL